MPIINDDQVKTTYDPVIQIDRPVETPVPSHSSLDIWSAAFKQNNTISSTIENFQTADTTHTQRDPEFNPFTGDYLHGYENYADKFTQANNKYQADVIKGRIDSEHANKRILAESGAEGMLAQVTAGAVDPFNLATMLIAPEAMVGKTILSSAAKSAAIIGSSAAVYEGALQSTQDSKTTSESVHNVIAAAVTGGILGSAAKWLSKDSYNALTTSVANDLSGVTPAPSGFASAGASATRATTLAEEKLHNVEGLVSHSSVTPNQRLSTSPSVEVRRAHQDLAVDPFRREKNYEGIATPISVETAIGRSDAMVAAGVEHIDNQFGNFTKIKTVNPVDLTSELKRAGAEFDEADLLANPNKFMNRVRFKELVSGALRNGDRSAFPEVQATAQFLRGKIFDPMKKAAMDSGLLPADLAASPTAESYLSRVWNTQKMAERQGEFQARIGDWIKRIDPANTDAEGVANDVFHSIMGNSNAGVSFGTNMVGKAAALKDRVLMIPDNEIADFLDNDIEKIVHRYTRSMTGDIAMKERFGDNNMTSQFTAINRDYDNLIATKTSELEAAGKSGDIQAATADLNKQRRADVNDLTHLRDKVLGKMSNGNPEDPWKRSLAAVRSLNAVSRLGMMTVSSISDLGRLVWANGLTRFAPALVHYFGSSAFRTISKEEGARIGYAVEDILHGRIQTLGDFQIENAYSKGNMVEKGIQYITKPLNSWSGMGWWNNNLKSLAGTLHADRMMEGITQYSSLGKKEVAYLAQHGIDENMATRMADQFTKFGEEHSGFHQANTASWEDAIARDAFDNAIFKGVNHTINTPSAGTLPIFMSKDGWKTVMQFKSFLYASHEQTMLAGIQEADGRALQGVLAMAALGAVSVNLKAVISGKDLVTDPKELMFNAIDSSGFAPFPLEFNNDLGKFGVPTLQSMVGIGQSKRYDSRSSMDIVAGPTGGTIQGIGQVLGDTFQNGFSAKDTHAIRKLLPYQNLWATKYALDKIEEKFNDTFGVPNK